MENENDDPKKHDKDCYIAIKTDSKDGSVEDYIKCINQVELNAGYLLPLKQDKENGGLTNGLSYICLDNYIQFLPLSETGRNEGISQNEIHSDHSNFAIDKENADETLPDALSYICLDNYIQFLPSTEKIDSENDYDTISVRSLNIFTKTEPNINERATASVDQQDNTEISRINVDVTKIRTRNKYMLVSLVWLILTTLGVSLTIWFLKNTGKHSTIDGNTNVTDTEHDDYVTDVITDFNTKGYKEKLNNTKGLGTTLLSYSYSGIRKSYFSLSKEMKLNHANYDGIYLRLTRQEVWVIGIRTTVTVYNRSDGTFLRMFKPYTPVTKLEITDSNQIIVACGTKGLNVIDKQGRHMEVIYNEGRKYYNFLSLWRGYLYCLKVGSHWDRSSDLGTVLEFKSQMNKWVFMGEVKLEGHYSLITADRLFVRGNGTYVFSHVMASLSLHHPTTGKLIRKYKYKDRIDPIVCGVDINGTVLVVDASLNPPQLCDLLGVCSDLTLDTVIQSPKDAMVDPADNTLWVVNKETLYKFIPVIH